MIESVQGRRKRWQFHLSTAVLCLVAVGVIMRIAIPWWRLHVMGITPDLERIEHADAAADAIAAMRRNDFRMIFIYGEGAKAPGIAGLRYAYPGDVPVIGTGCMAYSIEHRRLQDLAWDYAEKYNRIIVQEINSRGDAGRSQRPVAAPEKP